MSCACHMAKHSEILLAKETGGTIEYGGNVQLHPQNLPQKPFRVSASKRQHFSEQRSLLQFNWSICAMKRKGFQCCMLFINYVNINILCMYVIMVVSFTYQKAWNDRQFQSNSTPTVLEKQRSRLSSSSNSKRRALWGYEPFHNTCAFLNKLC